MNSKKLLAVIVVILLVLIGVIVWQNRNSKETTSTEQSQSNINQQSSLPTVTPSPTATPTQSADANSQTFEKDLAAKGTSWTLARVTVNQKNLNMDVNVSAPLTLQFDAAKKTYSGFAGCNSFSGTYTSSGSLAFDFGTTVSTKKACPAQALENGIFQAMDKVSTFGINGNQLVFTSEDGFTELVYNPAI